MLVTPIKKQVQAFFSILMYRVILFVNFFVLLVVNRGGGVISQ